MILAALRPTSRLGPLVLLILAGACDSMLGGLERPRAEVTGLRLADLALDGVVLDFAVEIRNPYALPLPLTDMAYELAFAGKPALLSGKAPAAGTVPARASRTIGVPVALSFARLFELGQEFRPGRLLPFEAALELSVDAPGVGPIALPLRRRGELPIPAVPGLALQSFRWENVSATLVSGMLDLGITNRNEFPMDLGTLDYALRLGGAEVARQSIASGLSLAPGASGVLRIPFSFSPLEAGSGILGLLSGGSAFELDGGLAVHTPYGPLRVPARLQGMAPSR
jgi:LEA14-like dessication related protein